MLMNALDIAFLIIIAFLFIRGCFRGMVREVASIAGLVLGFFLANNYHTKITPFYEPIVRPEYAYILSYLTIFLGTMLAVLVISSILRKILKLIMLGWLDHLGGGILGLLKGALLVSIIFLILTAFLPKKSELLASSRTAPYVIHFNDQISALLPKDLKDKFQAKSAELKEFWKSDWAKKISPMKKD